MTIKRSPLLVAGAGMACLALTLSWLTISSTERVVDGWFQVASKTEAQRHSARLAERAKAAERTAYFRLTAAGNPVLPGVFGPLTKGSRITVTGEKGQLQTLQVADIRPFHIPARSKGIARRKSVLLVTFKDVSSPSGTKIHMLVEQSKPFAPPRGTLERPL